MDSETLGMAPSSTEFSVRRVACLSSSPAHSTLSNSLTPSIFYKSIRTRMNVYRRNSVLILSRNTLRIMNEN